MRARPTIIACLLAAVLTVVLVDPTTALAAVVPGETVPTEATITGTGSPPIIKALWELPDNNFDIPGTQVDIVPSGTKDVLVYIVVVDPNGRGDIAQVFADVLDPYGNFKMSVAAEWLDPDYPRHETEIKEAKVHAAFSETGTWTTNLPEMLQDPTLPPVPAEPITLEVEDEINEEIFNTETAHMYRAIIPMEYCQIGGRYTVEAWATDKSGEQSFRLESWFLWVETKVLELDFNAVDFGEIVPCVEKVVPGDYVMDPVGPAPPVKPTVKNEGNVHLGIALHATAMVGVDNGKEITKFDVKFKDRKTYFNACEPTELPKPLRLCETEKIIFSVHADEGTPADTYKGTLTLSISQAKSKCPVVVDNSGRTTFYGVFVGANGKEAAATDMRDALCTYPGWTVDNTSLCLAPTKRAIAIEIDRYKALAKPCDEFIFYFNGHGGKVPDADGDERDNDGDEHILVANSTGVDEDGDGLIDEDPIDGVDNDGDGLIDEDPAGYRITDDELTTLLTGFKECVSIVVIIDTCYAGGFVGGTTDLQSLMTCNNSIAVLMACTGAECSLQFSRDGGLTWRGIFTIGCLDGLKPVGATTKADKNSDGITTAEELFCHADPIAESDNDGDAAIDEDPVDGMDNDGDGLVDEDPVEPPQQLPQFKQCKCPCDP